MNLRSRPRTALANGRSPTVSPSDRVEAVIGSLLVVAVVGLSVGTIPAASALDETTAQGAPELVIEDATVTPGGDESVAIVLTDAPDGLAGFELTVAVESDEIGTIQGGEYPHEYGMTTDPVLEDGERSITVEAADLDDEITPGATDVTMATIDLTGESPGETAVRVTSARLDADDGDPIEAAVVNGTLTVDDGSGADQNSGNGGPETGDALAGAGPLAALTAVGCIVVLIFIRAR